MSSARSIAPSEIARNVKYFEIWSTYHVCEQVAMSDLPDDLKADVLSVFDVDGKLPLTWVDKTSPTYRHLSSLAPDLHKFIQSAHRSTPSLFSSQSQDDENNDVFSELHCVYLAWRQLQWMRRTKEKWSETDFVANVYNVFRSPAVRESAFRTQCNIALPLHVLDEGLKAPALRILKAKSVIPDSAIFIRSSAVRPLSTAKSSPWKVLNSHPHVRKHCSDESSFRWQSSPCVQPTEQPCFEFASCFWEDKKPNCDLLECAYRQNRMAAAAAVRHLHSLHIKAPVFGLVWSNGTVRAHVDWCSEPSDNGIAAVCSAPYSGPGAAVGEQDVFHEWELDKPSDILRVFLLIRNLDSYTAGRFRERVEDGVAALAAAMQRGDDCYRPWKRTEAVMRSAKSGTRVTAGPENRPPPLMVMGFPTPPQAPKGKKTKQFKDGSKGAARKNR